MFKCEKCGKEYQFEKSYNKHIEKCTYEDPRVYTCKICKKEFDKKGSLGGHMVSVHGNMNKKENYECPICQKILYTNKGAFENHVKLHDEEFNKNRGLKSSNTRKIFLNSEKGKEYKEKMRQRMLIDNPMYNQETINKMVKSRKEYFKNMTDEEYSKLVINFINAPKKGNAVNHSGKYTPTKPEQLIIDMNIDGLIYNGNKKDSKTIRFKNKTYKHSSTPDFIYQYDETKYIEVFGVYWHPKEDEEFYINSYQLNGYNVLIIWETELYDNLEEIKLKIEKFLKD